MNESSLKEQLRLKPHWIFTLFALLTPLLHRNESVEWAWIWWVLGNNNISFANTSLFSHPLLFIWNIGAALVPTFWLQRTKSKLVLHSRLYGKIFSPDFVGAFFEILQKWSSVHSINWWISTMVQRKFKMSFSKFDWDRHRKSRINGFPFEKLYECEENGAVPMS